MFLKFLKRKGIKKMVVIQKNCIKKQSKQKRNQLLVLLGKNAFVKSPPKYRVEMIPAQKVNSLRQNMEPPLISPLNHRQFYRTLQKCATSVLKR